MITKKALLIVDIQNDFCQGGSLEVPKSEEVIPLANQLQAYFKFIFATQDWHPKDHQSFASNQLGHSVGDVITLKNGIQQTLWPNHCVQGSKGAEFHPLLNTEAIQRIFKKGTNSEIDSYSAFYDNAHEHSTGLGDYLIKQQITDLYLIGLATDYCVKYSALDAIRLGFNVWVIEDACRGVDLQPGDVSKALAQMRAAGVKIINSKDIASSNQ